MNYKQISHYTVNHPVQMDPVGWLLSVESLLFSLFNDAILDENGVRIKEPARLHEAASYTREGLVSVEAFISVYGTSSTINGDIGSILNYCGVGMVQSFSIHYGRVYAQEGETHVRLTQITGLCEGDDTTRVITEHRHLVKEEPLDEF